MSDIKDIIPEKDWRKVKIQDYPAIPTPQNVPSEHFFNGLSTAVKNLEFLSKPTSWVTIPLESGVTTTYAPQLRKFGSVIEVNGIVIYPFPANTSYIHVGTIPDGFRPKRTIRFASLNLTSIVVVEILPNGEIRVGNRSGVATNSWTSIGCTYIID